MTACASKLFYLNFYIILFSFLLPVYVTLVRYIYGGWNHRTHALMFARRTGCASFHRKCSFHRKSILCGMTSGGAAQMLASPTDLVKV